MDLAIVVTAAAEAHQVIVREMLHQRAELWLWAEEVLANVCATSNDVLLELTVNGRVHLAYELSARVVRQEFIPLAAPDHLDHIPAGAAEEPFELLNDLAVAAHRAVESLQVAVHHPGEVVESFARGKGQRACRLWLIHLTVTEEGPDAAPRRVGEAAVVEVAVVARLIDRTDTAEAHGDGWELPEVWQETCMRIRREATMSGRLLAITVELRRTDAPLEIGA